MRRLGFTADAPTVAAGVRGFDADGNRKLGVAEFGDLVRGLRRAASDAGGRSTSPARRGGGRRDKRTPRVEKGRLGRWEEAERAWATLCAKSPKDGSAWRALGRVRRRLEDPAGALEAWLSAAQDPREVEALLLAGALQASRGETQAAQSSLGLARERAPGDPRVEKLAALIGALNEE